MGDLIFKLKIIGLDITSYIRELILLNECVILRGVGGFETTYQHAAFRKNKRTIAPPNKRVHFRPEMVKDNGVLERYLQKSLGINNEEASELIDVFVQAFFEELRESGKALLAGIGEFSLNEYGKLQFQELDNVNYLADSFGLDALDIDEKLKHAEEAKATPLTPVVTQRRKLTGWYITIGVLLLIISVTLIILISESSGVKIFTINAENKKAANQDIVVFGPQAPVEKDSLTKAIEETITKKTSPKTALSIDVTPTQRSIPEQRPTEPDLQKEAYYLIAGSFKNMRNAEIMKEQLLRKGFAPEVQYTGGNYYRVVIGKFSDKQAAIDELRRIRKQIDQSVWLWERN